DANVTFLQLLDRSVLPEAFVADVERISYASASLKINVALGELPNFSAVPGTEPGPQHRGTIHICPDQDYIERAFDDAKYGRPSALERVFNLTGGNIFQGAMPPGQLFAFRPVPGYARYRTPIRGLYLCGSAAHPGGGVMGTPGLNAAREILGRRKRRRAVWHEHR